MTDSPTTQDVAQPTTEDVRASVRAIILDMAPGAEGECEPDTDLVDGLGYHSLALLELAFTLEDEFDLPPIDEETARKITTVKDVQDIVVRMLADRTTT
ncbi:MAG: acyl carrier protein [Actinomycetes bacterium]